MPNITKQRGNRIVLTKKEVENVVPEYYTYINENGEEHKYVGIVSKSSSSAYGKTVTTHKVALVEHPAIAHVNSEPERFTYISKDGTEKQYKGNVSFDEITGAYFGVLKEYGITNTVIDIYEEK